MEGDRSYRWRPSQLGPLLPGPAHPLPRKKGPWVHKNCRSKRGLQQENQPLLAHFSQCDKGSVRRAVASTGNLIQGPCGEHESNGGGGGPRSTAHSRSYSPLRQRTLSFQRLTRLPGPKWKTQRTGIPDFNCELHKGLSQSLQQHRDCPEVTEQHQRLTGCNPAPGSQQESTETFRSSLPSLLSA